MKEIPKIHEGEYRFCLILWENEPIQSAKLAQLCKEQLGWSRTTTYTIIRRLTDRGVVKSEDAIVSSVVKKEEVQLSEMNELVEKTFEGSLPAFIAAFARRQKMSDEDIAALRRLIEQGGK
ncbi:MAG: BlaI/MecI/CopY family transcriptional regulator [Clostridia bacterium]|nr:BlaI/MecI/CopY family transcriptional regulator [Clostridia bacterium]